MNLRPPGYEFQFNRFIVFGLVLKCVEFSSIIAFIVVYRQVFLWVILQRSCKKVAKRKPGFIPGNSYFACRKTCDKISAFRLSASSITWAYILAVVDTWA